MKEYVDCSFCSKELKRQTWNYHAGRRIDNFFCDNDCKGSWQKKQRENKGFNKEWLENEYIVNKKSSNQIAREIGRDPKRIWEWIKDYGIETRPRGNGYGQGFKKGGISPFLGMTHTEKAKSDQREKRLNDGRVPYLKDGVHWMSHPDHKYSKPASWRGGVSPDRQAFYSTEEWANAVKKVWARDKAICQRCSKKHNNIGIRGTFHIHHIISFMHKEYRSKHENLILVCKQCHLWIHSKKNENKEFIKEI